jgi:hypothetical protein
VDTERLLPPNDPPNIPNQPSGITDGNFGISYKYITYTTDPDENEVKYYFDWGDESGIWTNFTASGQQVSADHIWNTAGTFLVKVKAQDIYGLESDWSPVLIVTIAENNPPGKPSTPSGPLSGKIEESYFYSTSSIDPEGHQIYYLFDWGDETVSDWSESFDSGEIASVSHIWMDRGDYQIRVKAKDFYDFESEWSESLGVSMPKNKYTLFPLHLLFNKQIVNWNMLEGMLYFNFNIY